jgi:WD40 repeat protein
MDYTNNQLLTGSHDGTVRVWDCGTGQCVFTSEVGGEVDSMLVEHGWLFVGVKTREGRGEVKGWALAGGAAGEVRLEGHVGQVTSLVMGNGMLFSGGQVRWFVVRCSLLLSETAHSNTTHHCPHD